MMDVWNKCCVKLLNLRGNCDIKTKKTKNQYKTVIERKQITKLTVKKK
jgi:hypothetical protein